MLLLPDRNQGFFSLSGGLFLNWLDSFVFPASLGDPEVLFGVDVTTPEPLLREPKKEVLDGGLLKRDTLTI